MSSAEQTAERPPVEPGQILAGKFRIERVIGEGGMGIVAEATHLKLDERVALKFLRREVMRMPDVVARFDREGRSAVKLKSEHVARVMDVGHTEDGIPYMVMEYLEGKDLAQMLTEYGPLPITDAVEYVIQACEGVGEAHARGIVHRDLKPENLFLAQRSDGWRTVKVLDFGISKAVLVGPSSVDLSSNNTSSIMGSPYYMSPEQLRSTRTVDHRADIWSLGVVLFELLTGMTIFDETKEFTELVADILEAPHRKLRAFRPDAPQGLEDVIDRCLEKDRTRRYQNVAELAVGLLPFAPKRARVTAERTASITKAAGLITDPNFQLPPSNFPPPDGRDSGPQAFGSPRVPAFTPSQGTPVTDPSGPPLVVQSTPSLPGSVETLAPPGGRKRPPLPAVIGGALALFALGSLLAFGLVRALRPAPSAAATSTLQTNQPSTAQPITTATTTTSVATGSATNTGEPSATAAKPNNHLASTAHPTGARTNVKPPPSASSGVKNSPTLDIQLQR